MSSTPQPAREAWEDLPFFMDELPADPLTDPRTALLMEFLPDEDDPNEAAANLKERANDFIIQHTKGKEALAKRQAVDEQGYRTTVVSKNPLEDAYKLYSEALERDITDMKLKAVLHCNRAYASLLKGNNGRAFNDSRTACELDPQNIKAYYRGAQALLNTGKARESIKMCDMGLEIQPANSAILKVRAQAEELYSAQKARLQEKYRRELEAKGLERALAKRGVCFAAEEWLFEGMREYDNNTRYERAQDQVIFSVLLLYDAVHQTDFVQEWHEHVTLREMLATVFDPSGPPPPWDTDRQYSPATVTVYVDDAESVERERLGEGLSVHGFVQCDLDCRLVDVLGHERVKVFGLPALHVVLRGSQKEREMFTGNGGSVTARIFPSST